MHTSQHSRWWLRCVLVRHFPSHLNTELELTISTEQYQSEGRTHIFFYRTTTHPPSTPPCD
jgi:hypothetical protein